jgi:hypothetical protein
MSAPEPSDHPAWCLIEPAVVQNGNRRQYAPGQHEIELSKAISLKRIADHLSGIRRSAIRAFGPDDPFPLPADQ